MNACEKYTVDLMLYLDDELLGEKLMDFLAHLKICADCRASLEEQLALSAVLRRSRPLYSAPPKLRARVAASLAHAGSETKSNQLYGGSGRWLWRTLQGVERLMPRWKVLVPAVLGIMLCFLLISNVVHEVRASEYVRCCPIDAPRLSERSTSPRDPVELSAGGDRMVGGQGCLSLPVARFADTIQRRAGLPVARGQGRRLQREPGWIGDLRGSPERHHQPVGGLQQICRGGGRSGSAFR